MNRDIAYILASKLTSCVFATRIAGLVMPVTFFDETEDGTKLTKVLPLAFQGYNPECVGDATIPMTPDSAINGIIYFEDGGTAVGRRFSFGQEYVSELTLVCWMNRERLNEGNVYTENLTNAAVNEILTLFGRGLFTESPYLNIQVMEKGVQPMSESIFSKYTYREQDTQYLMPPYEYFAINLSVKFTLKKNCITNITQSVAECPSY